MWGGYCTGGEKKPPSFSMNTRKQEKQTIYHMDNQLSELNEEERCRKRQLLVRPLVEALFAWLKKSGMKKWSQKEGK